VAAECQAAEWVVWVVWVEWVEWECNAIPYWNTVKKKLNRLQTLRKKFLGVFYLLTKNLVKR
jgi:hypothetical protein